MAKPLRFSQDTNNSRPAKRRKLNDKLEATKYLDVSTGEVSPREKVHLETLLNVIHKKRKIVVIAGAGISVSAGIPDFRSSTGIFKISKREHKLKSTGKDLFDAAVYKDDDSTTSFHTMVRDFATIMKSATATPFHHVLATLANEGRLLRLYTQNVDGIDTALPPLATKIPLETKGPWPKTVQLHGSLQKMVCTLCHKISDLEPRIFHGPAPPACPACAESDSVRTQQAGKRSHGIGRLRPRMVLYHEDHPDAEAIGSVVKADMTTRPDAILVVGTTLKVRGVQRIFREMSAIVRDRKDGGMVIWISKELPPKYLEFNLIVKGTCDFVARSAAMRVWNDPEHVDIIVEQPQRMKATQKIQSFNNPQSKKTFHDLATSVPATTLSLPFAPVDTKKPATTQGTIVSATALKVKRVAVNSRAEARQTRVKAIANPENPLRFYSMPTETKIIPPKRKAVVEEEALYALQPFSPLAARHKSNPSFHLSHQISRLRKSCTDWKGQPLDMHTT